MKHSNGKIVAHSSIAQTDEQLHYKREYAVRAARTRTQATEFRHAHKSYASSLDNIGFLGSVGSVSRRRKLTYHKHQSVSRPVQQRVYFGETEPQYRVVRVLERTMARE